MPISLLSFSGQGWLWPSVAFLVVCLFLLFWSYKLSPGGGLRWLCLGLKVLGLAALAVCLLEPLWFGQRAKPGSNLFAVVADNSQGMQIKDEGDSQSRGEHLQKLVDPAQANWLAEMSDTFELRRYVFDARLQATNDFHELVFDGTASGIGAALRTIGERFQGRNLAGVVLLTDGNATDLRDPLPDLSKLPPIYPVVIGQPGSVRDISLQQVAVSQTAFEDAPVTVQADVSVAGFRGQTISARVVDKDGKLVKSETKAGRGDGEVVPFHFELKPEQRGLSFFQVRTSTEAAADAKDPGAAPTDEATLANNNRVFVVNRDAGPYRILYVSGRPNWEFKFLNRALQEDKEVELSALIRVAKREPRFEFLGREGETSNPLYRGFGNQNAEQVEQFDQAVIIPVNPRDEAENTLLTAGFPRKAEDLYEYHAIILDDLEYEFFTVDQATLLQKFVSERGGGLLMLAGMESLQEGNYARTPIGDMLPVYLDRSTEMSSGPAAGMRMDLTREGWLQPWARLRDNTADEKARRDDAPPFYVVNHIRTTKPGASVIASLQTPGGSEVPALVTQRFGRGRTAVLTVGDLWAWGQYNEDARDDRDKTWRQFARWLVSDVPKRVEMTVEQQADQGANSVLLQIRVRDPKFQPLDEANVQVTVEPVLFGGTGASAAEPVKPLTLRAEPALTEPGLYQVSYVSRATGGYKATAMVTNSVGAEVGRAESGWSVDLAAEEFRSLLPNIALMESLARKTGGEVVMADKLGDFVKKLPNLKAPVMESWSYPLWHTSSMFAFALACLLAEWGIRRWKGMP